MPLLFIALPDPDTPELYGDGLPYAKVEAAAPGAGYSVAKGWKSIDQLFQMLEDAVRAAHDCLTALEIYAHGCPELCDGIVGADWARYFGQRLYDIPLCDRVDVFLSGCNTGVRTATAESIAQQVSRNTPRRNPDNKLVLVHGSVGYLRGTNLEQNTSTEEWVFSRWRKYAPYPDVSVGGVVSPGSTKASGANCYRTFCEGVG